MNHKYQKITVGGLLVKNNKALVLRRSKKEPYLTGYYELPGGKVDFGENPEESLEREFKEETNLKVKVQKPYRVFTYVSNHNKIHTVEIAYLAELNDKIKNIKLSEEHDNYKWISLKDVYTIKISDEIKNNIIDGFKILKIYI